MTHVKATIVRHLQYVSGEFRPAGLEQVHLKISTPEGERQLRELVARAINCWPEKPQWVQDLSDSLNNMPTHS